MWEEGGERVKDKVKVLYQEALVYEDIGGDRIDSYLGKDLLLATIKE